MDDSFSSDSSYSKTDARGTRPTRYDAPPPKSKGRTWVWVVLGVVLVFVFYLAFRHHDNGTQAAAPKGGKKGFGGPVTINTVTAKKGDIGVYLNAIGTVTPVYTASITSQVTGSVIAVHYKEGQIVRKGDPLIEIDPRPYQAKLVQAQGTLERDRRFWRSANGSGPVPRGVGAECDSEADAG